MQGLDLENIEKFSERILLQSMRELMLMQSSDWQFLIHTLSAKDYSEQRFFFHFSDFNRLCDLAEKTLQKEILTNDEILFLESVELRDSIFPELRLEWWSDNFI